MQVTSVLPSALRLLTRSRPPVGGVCGPRSRKLHHVLTPQVLGQQPLAIQPLTSRSYSDMSTAITAAKRAAGHKAIDEHLLPSYTAVGVGSGSTVVFCVERIKQLVDEKKLSSANMVFVPTGFQSKNLILDAGLPLKEIDQFSGSGIDIVFDGADEIDSDLNCIKGGGACQFQEKLVGLAAKKFIVVADDSKVSNKLGEKWLQGVPIEVVQPAMRKVTADLRALGAKEVTLRLGGKAKAGPIVTDNGNFILDAYFGTIDPGTVSSLDKKIKVLVGVVETGLFDYASEAYIGKSDGTFSVLKR